MCLSIAHNYTYQSDLPHYRTLFAAMMASVGGSGDSPLTFAARMKRQMEERAADRKRRAALDLSPSQDSGSSAGAAPVAHPDPGHPPTVQTKHVVPSTPGHLINGIARRVR